MNSLTYINGFDNRLGRKKVFQDTNARAYLFEASVTRKKKFHDVQHLLMAEIVFRIVQLVQPNVQILSPIWLKDIFDVLAAISIQA